MSRAFEAPGHYRERSVTIRLDDDPGPFGGWRATDPEGNSVETGALAALASVDDLDAATDTLLQAAKERLTALKDTLRNPSVDDLDTIDDAYRRFYAVADAYRTALSITADDNVPEPTQDA